MALNIALFIAMAGLGPTNPEGHAKVMNTLALDPVAMGLHSGGGGGLESWGDDPSEEYGEPEVRFRTDKDGKRVMEAVWPAATRGPRGNGGWWTLLSYQFVHGDFLHILGNLLVLWVFGPAVEDRFGRLGFALFYLLGGVLAGVMHGVFQPNPVIGASGSIAAVTGAFLVLFPRTHVKLLLFFIYVGVYELPAWVFIAFAVVKDIWGAGIGGGGVAFLAHIGGYAFGFSVAMALIVTKLLPDEDYSLFAIARHAKRRADFKASAREAEMEWKKRIEKPSSPQTKAPAEKPRDPESGRGAGYGQRVKVPTGGVEERVLWQRVDAKEAEAMTDRESARAAELRAALQAKVAADDAAGASHAFRSLLREGQPTRGNRRVLVEAGNLFAAAGKHRDAADAYETFLASLKGFTDAEEGRVRLMLALMYQRYLKDSPKAAAAMAGIKGSFSDAELQGLAEMLREELKAKTG